MYNIVTRHLYTLQKDYPDQSSSHPAPSMVIPIVLTLGPNHEVSEGGVTTWAPVCSYFQAVRLWPHCLQRGWTSQALWTRGGHVFPASRGCLFIFVHPTVSINSKIEGRIPWRRKTSVLWINKILKQTGRLLSSFSVLGKHRDDGPGSQHRGNRDGLGVNSWLKSGFLAAGKVGPLPEPTSHLKVKIVTGDPS